jgi:hypothetical protein
VGVGWGLSCFLCVLFLCSFFLTFLSFPYVLLFPFIYLLLFISFCLFPFVYFSLLFRSDFPFPSLRSFLSFCLSSFIYLSFCLFPFVYFLLFISLLCFLYFAFLALLLATLHCYSSRSSPHVLGPVASDKYYGKATRRRFLCGCRTGLVWPVSSLLSSFLSSFPAISFTARLQ